MGFFFERLFPTPSAWSVTRSPKTPRAQGVERDVRRRTPSEGEGGEQRGGTGWRRAAVVIWSCETPFIIEKNQEEMKERAGLHMLLSIALFYEGESTF
jgi:hypothetical protein